MHKQTEHDEQHTILSRLEKEVAQCIDSYMTHENKATPAAARKIEGAHTYHCVHEKVEPAVHKKIVPREVVHVTAPIHGKRQAGARSHGISALLMKTMDEVGLYQNGIMSGQHG